jgi:hypothetical protein
MHKLEIKEISIKESARNSILITLENAAAVYLDFFNNYVSKEKFAEHNGIDTKLCDLILEIGKHALNNQESFNFPEDL